MLKTTTHIFRKLLSLCVFVLLGGISFGQVTKDSVKSIAADTAMAKPATVSEPQDRTAAAADDTGVIPVKKEKWQPNPKKAGLYSAILPGLGQLYNRQYWKVPLVYAGIAAAGYFIATNLDKYTSYRKGYINRINNPNYVDQYSGVYSQDQLQQLQNDYSKYLDLTVLFTGIGFMVQVVDAITSAHLKNFDISRDISMRVRPVASPWGAGIGLVMNF